MVLRTKNQVFASMERACAFQREKSTSGHNTRLYRREALWVVYWSPGIIEGVDV